MGISLEVVVVPLVAQKTYSASDGLAAFYLPDEAAVLRFLSASLGPSPLLGCGGERGRPRKEGEIHLVVSAWNCGFIT